jgi:hypothetical protein
MQRRDSASRLGSGKGRMQGVTDSKPDRLPARVSPLVDGRFALAAAAALAATCVILWLTGWHTRGWISAWPRFADDAYYYLVIARNAAGGHGLTMDQLSPTNGFQPLWMGILVPVAWLLGSDPDLLLLMVQALCVAIFASAGGLLCGLVRAHLGAVPALLAGLLLLFPTFENVALSGLESSLLILVMIMLSIEALRSGALSSTEPRAADARTGALVGLLMLARLDSVFIGLTLAAYVAARGLARGEGAFAARLSRTVRKELALFWPAVALLTPYLAWNVLAFGHPMPISGRLKSSFPEANFTATNLNLQNAVLFLLALGAVGRGIWRGNGRDPLVNLLALLSIGLVLHALYTVVYMPWAVFSWHFAALIPVGALGAALLARDAVESLPHSVVVAALAGLTLAQAGALAFSISRLDETFTIGAREGGEWVAANLPPDAVLAMKDSGIFSYFAQRRVMNLDGVANSFEFANAVCAGRLEDFARDHGVEYVAQHSVPPSVRSGAYETFTQVYPCHLLGGHDSDLVLRRDLEVYRGTPYKSDGGCPEQLLIWRLPR